MLYQKSFWIKNTPFYIIGILFLIKRRGYPLRYLSTLLLQMDPVTEFIKLGSTPFKESATLGAKTGQICSPLEKQLHLPLKTGSLA
jgi:hypothetical protein